jgi:nicotinate-nucleotide adenylyltransferase
MKKIGIYSGTFDPVHNGHISFCLEAIKRCELDKVVLLPEEKPRNKANVTDLRHRQAMLESAVRDYDQLEVRVIGQPQFTVERTLPLLTERYAGDQLVFLFGSDIVHGSMGTWPGLRQLFESAELAIGLRGGDTAEKVAATFETFEEKLGIKIDHTLVSGPDAGISSTAVRNTPLQIDGITRDTAEYIALHKLYGSISSGGRGILL